MLLNHQKRQTTDAVFRDFTGALTVKSTTVVLMDERSHSISSGCQHKYKILELERGVTFSAVTVKWLLLAVSD